VADAVECRCLLAAAATAAVAAAAVAGSSKQRQLVKCEIVMDRHPAHSIRLTSLRSNIHLATFRPRRRCGVSTFSPSRSYFAHETSSDTETATS